MYLQSRVGIPVTCRTVASVSHTRATHTARTHTTITSLYAATHARNGKLFTSHDYNLFVTYYFQITYLSNTTRRR